MVQWDLKPYSMPAPHSQPLLVLEPLQLVPLGKLSAAVSCTQPPPTLAKISHRSAASPKRAASVPIHCSVADACTSPNAVATGTVGRLKLVQSKSPSMPISNGPAC